MRVSRTVLREAEGETPSAYSPMGNFSGFRSFRHRSGSVSLYNIILILLF